MEPRPASPKGAAAESGAGPRQRWRLVVARSADAPRLAGRELADAWEVAVEAIGLPLHRPAGRARTRVAFGAPLQLGIAAERELVELFLVERVSLWRMREAIAGRLPEGWSLIDLYDVWVGGPSLAGQVNAADYRIELEGNAELAEIAEAASALLNATELPRVRSKGSGSIAYDLRPLLVDLVVADSWPPAVADGGPPAVVRVRTRIHPELGSGRPEEVVAALGDRLGHPLEVLAIARERLILADELA